MPSLVGSEMCIRDSLYAASFNFVTSSTSNPPRVFVSGVPAGWSPDVLRKFLERAVPDIAGINLVKNKLGQQTGKALITLKTQKQAQTLISFVENVDLKINDEPLRLQAKPFVVTEGASDSLPRQDQENKTLYLSNIPFTVTPDELKAFAERFGGVEEINMPLSSNKKNKGFAFISFNHSAEANNFISFIQERDFMGRKLRIQYTKKATAGEPTVQIKREAPTQFEQADLQKSQIPHKIEERPIEESLRLYKYLQEQQTQKGNARKQVHEANQKEEELLEEIDDYNWRIKERITNEQPDNVTALWNFKLKYLGIQPIFEHSNVVLRAVIKVIQRLKRSISLYIQLRKKF
eukprot:TRINITY_DN3546_c0_g1_i2.p1 TRINITY_DN3546_c0_g1~~TRINITY_DN3546_c0_g1_i2.p1  ORF type:complete len:349 (-),score=77.00 TRINITY_DN3546_c0_g1_i2:272-1318(-)